MQALLIMVAILSMIAIAFAVLKVKEDKKEEKRREILIRAEVKNRERVTKREEEMRLMASKYTKEPRVFRPQSSSLSNSYQVNTGFGSYGSDSNSYDSGSSHDSSSSFGGSDF